MASSPEVPSEFVWLHSWARSLLPVPPCTQRVASVSPSHLPPLQSSQPHWGTSCTRRESRAFISGGASCLASSTLLSAHPSVSSWLQGQTLLQMHHPPRQHAGLANFMLKCIQMDQRLTHKTETGRPLEENIREKTCDIGLGNFFSTKGTKSTGDKT